MTGLASRLAGMVAEAVVRGYDFSGIGQLAEVG